MASTSAIVATVLALIFTGAVAQAPAPEPAVALGPSAPSPTSDCMTNVFNMSDCLTYVEAGSNATKPDKACCPELAGLVESAPTCLCYLLDKNTTKSFGINIDTAKALKLPSVCGVSTPPVSLCSVITGVPTASDGSPAFAPEGLAANPTTGNKDNGVASTTASAPLFIFLTLASASLPTFFGI